VAPANATNQAVTWTSSAAAVATVSTTGVVTAVAPGAASITVTTADGAMTAVATVTVTAPVVAVTGVSVTPATVSLVTGGTQSLTATVAPANATNQAVTWTSSAAAVAAVSVSGVVTAVGPGAASITVTTADGAKTAVATITVTQAYPSTTGLVEWLKFDDAAGTVATDSSSGVQNGTLMNGATWSPSGKRGGAVSLSGTGTQYVDVPDQSLAGDFTVAAWVNLVGFIDNKDAVVGNAGAGPDMNFSLAGLVRLFQNNPSAPATNVLTATTAVAGGTWAHVAAVRTGTTTTLYVNGVAAGSTMTWIASLPVKVVGWGNAGYFGGLIDDFLLYNRALNAGEIGLLAAP